MARKTINVATEPHVATLGTTDLLFEPVVESAEYLGVYQVMRETIDAIPDPADGDMTGRIAQNRQVSAAVRAFSAAFMLPESAEVFAGMRLPDAALTDLMNFVGEIYGGGSRPTSSSSGSPRRSSKTGKRSTASSPSAG